MKRSLIGAILLLCGFAAPAFAQQGSTGVYWQCQAPSSSNPNGGYCPVGNTYPMPVYNQALNGVAVTNSDSTVITATRALFNGNSTACNIAVQFVNGSGSVTLQNVAAGQLLPISVNKVFNSNTTCSNIVALY